ncbi:GntR family transcriptional regulator [Nonomuraea sp. 10N515B]|uniref:GntR family transcriptional regulator n=1 Tax=Nonomuraea sp. 10N515B TaxID=3457422 RepID=UPI003FCDFD6E
MTRWEPAPDQTVWEQVYDELRTRIEAEVYKPRNPVPSITQLEQEFGVARGTVRKVLAKLARDGLVRPISGKGTYVVPREERGESVDS